jgi:beta-1,4-mannosyl-glycoprotein beta-1,4-N-acetylglucosaminyltransferase
MFNSKDITIYDYSSSNIKILNQCNDTIITKHLPYINYDSEKCYLSNLNKNTEKIYDFGMISDNKIISCERRALVVNHLVSNGYTVNVITGWKEMRDQEIAKCKVILNIHGFFNEPTAIFEHIRCDRLLSAGFEILSENSLHVDNEFIEKYPNLTLIDYNDFFNCDIIKQYKNNNNDKFNMKIFIVHYKKLTERKISILDQFRKYNITNYEFIEIDRDELYNYNCDIFDKNFGNALTAISLSHYSAYQKIIDSHEEALIFEDDVILCDNFVNKLQQYLRQLPSDYDILFIGNGCNLHVDVKQIEDNKFIYKRNVCDGFFRCADSYIINKKCCLKLKNCIDNQQSKINRAIDSWLEIVLQDNNCNVYWAEPTIVMQGSQNGSFDRSWFHVDLNNTMFNNCIQNLKELTPSEFFKNLTSEPLYDVTKCLKFFYGISKKHIDITRIVLEKCIINDELIIPPTDNERTAIFTDPMFGIIKDIYIVFNESCYCKIVSNLYTLINLQTNIGFSVDSFDPQVLTCFESPYSKKRIGKNFDGGYIICDIPDIKYDFLLSCGVCDDISFEEQFCEIYKSVKCHAYDGTIENININNSNIKFIKKNINYFNDNNNTNLHLEIENYDNIFLKMDIEGFEIPWMNTLTYKQLNKFSQIVIEFHFPFSFKEVPIFDKLNKTHILIHFHPNNCCGTRNHKGIIIPNVFECTFIHKKYYNQPYKLNTELIPGSLDMKNVFDNNEISLNHEPFVFSKKKIIDCFIFYNELDLLSYRLNLLNDVVDYFVLVESTKTFVGKQKPLFYSENNSLFSDFKDKIITIVVDDIPFDEFNIDINNGQQWQNEIHQRRCISRGIDKLDLKNDDVIIITDIDEIPNPEILQQIHNNCEKDFDIAILQMDFYYYNLNCKRNEKWNYAKICTYKNYLDNARDCQKIRNIFNCKFIEHAGWHLSYFGDTNFIQNKIKNFSHQELNNDTFTDKNIILKKIENCKDLFDRDNNSIDNSMKYISVIDNNNLPPMYNSYLQNYYKNEFDNKRDDCVEIKSEDIHNYCFIHSCCLENGKTERLDYLIHKLISTGCISYLTKIFIINIGHCLDDDYIKQFKNENKFEIVNYSKNTNLQESPTINKMILFSKNNKNCNILYIHTKGVRYSIDDTKQIDWINMMTYFLLHKYQRCIHLLNDGYSSVGCNCHDGSDGVAKHYSGNFWWAKSNHLRKLEYLSENVDTRNTIEFHLFTVDHKHFVMHNSKINHYLENYPPEKYKILDDEQNVNKIIGFHTNQLCERGTTIALYDYAYFNQKMYNNKSIIFYCKHSYNNDPVVITKFKKEFKCYAYDNFSDIDQIILNEKIDYFYNTKSGEKSDGQLVKNCPNLIHAVFSIEVHGERYASISKQLASKYNNIVDFVPYMINLPTCNENLRNQLQISNDCVVVGRIGGYHQFDIRMAHSAIKTILESDLKIMFIFVNTEHFYEHSQIIYINKIIDPIEKVKFINTCDVMIHARSDGETFGLAVGEFSSLNKPVITCVSNVDNSHIDILGDKAIIFDSEDSLIRIFKNIKNIISSKSDWNAYRDYTPEKVMKKFMDVFVNPSHAVNMSNSIENIEYVDMNVQSPHFHNNKELVIVSAFLDIDRRNWSKYQRTVEYYILSFGNYFNYRNKMVVFIDDNYIEELKVIYKKYSHNNAIFIPINKEWMSKNIYAWQQLDISESIMESESYKNLLNDRIVRGCPENIYPTYNAINHSKIDFICYAVNNNLINNDSFICWSDFGYFHSILHNNPSKYPVGSIDITKFKSDKLTFCLRNKLDNNDRGITYTLVNAPEKFTGSFFAGPTNLMLKMQKLYHTSLKEIYDNNVSDDDQHIYLRCFLKEPQLFHLYLDTHKWPEALCYFEKYLDRFELTKMLISNINNGKFVEIGCDRGLFSKHILTVNKTATLYSIDPYISYNDYNDAINNVTGDNLYNKVNTELTQEFGGRVKLIREFSNKANNLVPDNLDFIYIDGNHQYSYVYEDLCIWWEKLSPNGIIVGDDAVDIDESQRNTNGNIFIEWCPGSYGEYGVIKAFNQFISEKKCKSKLVGNQYVIFK